MNTKKDTAGKGDAGSREAGDTARLISALREHYQTLDDLDRALAAFKREREVYWDQVAASANGRGKARARKP